MSVGINQYLTKLILTLNNEFDKSKKISYYDNEDSFKIEKEVQIG